MLFCRLDVAGGADFNYPFVTSDVRQHHANLVQEVFKPDEGHLVGPQQTPMDIGCADRSKAPVAYRLIAPDIAVPTQVLYELAGIRCLHQRVLMEVDHYRVLHQTLESPLLISVERNGYQIGLDNLLRQGNRARSHLSSSFYRTEDRPDVQG
jgi:hypothetical protein